MSFFSWLQGLFASKHTTPTEVPDRSDDETEIVPRPASTSEFELPKQLEYFLSPSELAGVRAVCNQGHRHDEVSVVRMAIRWFNNRLEAGQAFQIAVPPPVKPNYAWRFSVGSKTEGRLSAIGRRIGLHHHNNIIRIAVREYIVSRGVMIDQRII